MCALKNEHTNEKKIKYILDKHIYGFIHYLKFIEDHNGKNSDEYHKFENKEMHARYESNDLKNLKKYNKTFYLHVKYVEVFDRYLYYNYPDIQIDQINEDIINKYKDYCINELKNTNKTLNKKLSTLSKFFNYLTVSKKLFKYNIMFNVRYVKNETEKKPTILTTNQIRLLFDVMRNYIYGQRCIVISKLILETGMLTRDILNLKISQLSRNDKTITIDSKRNNIKIYKLSNSLYEALNDYLLLRNTFDVNGSPYLFLSSKGNQYSIRSYQIFFAEAVRRCDFEITYTPRHLRSTFLYNVSKLVSEERLKEIASQNKVKQYYEELLDNPLRNIK
ncbi:site-specific integrase (plasmid) [Clostridium beijerinckii]|uniref:tyrosine-type recombinase/integrase n=1 Tax=Clostridium beijerinckii TaxID=1520 RepID=UPI00222658E3|nr:site-specific integrase [Clostridium beijerinckii]UYZ38950.1 site-specific integrase [Clostridium beijerinckii]